MAISFDLKAHDATFHHGNFDEQAYKTGKVTCKFRDRIHDYENVDDLSQAQNITDALEDAELLDEMMAAALDDETKKGLAEKIKGTEEILAKILGKKTGGAGGVAGAPTQFGPNVPLKHDKKAFPDKSDAKWQDALAHYGDPSYGWKSAGSGSTNPHMITFNGKRYFVKQAGNNPSYDKAAARNEANANNFLRLAGLNAPDSMYLKANNGDRFCITTEADLSGGHLDAKLGDKKIAEQVKAAYPIMSLLYNMDIMQNSDNAFIDKNGTPMFLDNGSTFGFSAQGVRNKRFDFDAREDPEKDSPNFTALANFHGNNSGENWRKAIMGSSKKDVDMETALREAAKYEMGALVREADKQGLLKQLPKKGKDALVAYADALDKMSAKYKSKAAPASAPASPSQAGSAGGSGSSAGTTSAQQQGGGTANSQQKAIEDLAKKYGLNVPTIKDNGDGTKTMTGFGSNVDFQKLRGFVKELNEKGLLPGFLASISQNGNMTVAPAINSSSLAASIRNVYSVTSSGFMNAMTSNLSRPSSSGSFSFGSSYFGGNQTGAVSFANMWNSANSNSGYTAKATQNANGDWEVTLYPTDQKKIAATYSSSESGSGSSGSSGTTSTSSSTRSSSASSSSGSTSSGSSGSSGASGTTSAQQHATASSGAKNQQAPQKPKTPPPAPTITPAQQKQVQQVKAMPPTQRARAISRLQRMLAMPNLSAGNKATYQAMINLMNGLPANYQAPVSSTTAASGAGVSASGGAASASAPAASSSGSGIPANVPSTPAAQRLLKMINDPKTSPAMKKNYVALLNKIVGAASK